jgi:nitrous oxidase accessory protein NosD
MGINFSSNEILTNEEICIKNSNTIWKLIKNDIESGKLNIYIDINKDFEINVNRFDFIIFYINKMYLKNSGMKLTELKKSDNRIYIDIELLPPNYKTQIN